MTITTKSAQLLESIKAELRAEIRAELMQELTARQTKARAPWDDVKELVSAAIDGNEVYGTANYYALLNAVSVIVRRAFRITNVSWLTPEQGAKAVEITSAILQMMDAVRREWSR